MTTAEELIAFEKTVADEFNAGYIRAPIHLDGNNEAPLITIFEKIKPTDWVLATWRSHYKALLHGVPAEKVKAEIMAGRSISMSFPEHRFLSSAIVGGCLPIAVGIALSIKRVGGGDRVFCFIGDMAARGGMYHECRQYTEGHQLPVHFIVEDNGKSVCTDTAAVWGDQYDYYNPWRFHPWQSETRFKYDAVFPHSGTGKFVEWT